MRPVSRFSSAACLLRRSAEFLHAGDERVPCFVHFGEGVAAGARQLVILPRRTVGGVFNGGADEPVGFQAAQNRIDGAVADDESVVAAQRADDVVAVEAIAVERVEDGQVERALAKLRRPTHDAAPLYLITR